MASARGLSRAAPEAATLSVRNSGSRGGPGKLSVT
jgi:hypothetical protein